MKRTVLAVFSALLFVGLIGILKQEAPVAQATSGGYATKCGGGKILLNANEKKTFALHNEARRDRNLRALCVHPALQKAARAHSKDMIDRDYFSHDTKGRNEDACQRIRRYGYQWRACGENIGYNSTPDKMFDAWMNSPDHRGNILGGKYREVGIGAHTGNFRGFQTTMYTVDFGTR